MDENDGVNNSTAATAAAVAAAAAAIDYESIRAMFRNQVIITKVVSFLSIMGSAYIIFSMVVNVKDAAHRRKKLDRTFDRLLLCLCAADFVSSTSFFLGSW